MSESAKVSFIDSTWLKVLWKELESIWTKREREIQAVLKDFEDPRQLARYYVEPDCQHINPANRHEDTAPASDVRSPVFRTVNAFLSGEFAVCDSGKNVLFRS